MISIDRRTRVRSLYEAEDKKKEQKGLMKRCEIGSSKQMYVAFDGQSNEIGQSGKHDRKKSIVFCFV